MRSSIAVEGEHERPDGLHARGHRPLHRRECGPGGVAHGLEAADSALAQARARRRAPGREQRRGHRVACRNAGTLRARERR